MSSYSSSAKNWSFFDVKEMSEAILAAAESNKQFSSPSSAIKIKKEQKYKQQNKIDFCKKEGGENEENVLQDGEVEEEEVLDEEEEEQEGTSFLHRLYQNSQLISTNNNNKEEEMETAANSIVGVFEKTTENVLTNNSEQNAFTSPLPAAFAKPKRVTIKFPRKIVAKLNELFGDDDDEEEEEKEEDEIENKQEQIEEKKINGNFKEDEEEKNEEEKEWEEKEGEKEGEEKKEGEKEPENILTTNQNCCNNKKRRTKKKAKKQEVQLPIWLCEMLYKAMCGLHVPDELPNAGEENSSALMNGRSDELDSSQKCKKRANNRAWRVSALTSLYQILQDVPAKTIKHFAKENSYDFERTANELLNIAEVSEMNLDGEEGANDEQQPEEFKKKQQSATTFKVIVPSEYPHVIYDGGQKQQQQKKEQQLMFVPPQLQYDDVEQFDQKIENLEEQRLHYIKLANEARNKPLSGGALFNHYVKMAKALQREQFNLQLRYDQFRACRSREDFFIDLHDMTWERALASVKFKIDFCRANFPHLRKLSVITGYGSKSGHPSVIRARLQKFLKNTGIDHFVSPQNQGVVEIRLQGIHSWLSDAVE